MQKYNFDLLEHQEPSGLRRLRYLALAHIKDGKSASETALALRVTPPAFSQWMKWFVDEDLDRVAGISHCWSPQRLPKRQEEVFHRAVEQLQHSRGSDANAFHFLNTKNQIFNGKALRNGHVMNNRL